jgi:hypothetical protein
VRPKEDGAAGGSSAAGGPTRVRSAEEIRAAYGRSANRRTNELRSVMEVRAVGLQGALGAGAVLVLAGLH